MHDNAALSGATAGFTPTGAITFTFSGGALGANAATEVGFDATSERKSVVEGQGGDHSCRAGLAGDRHYKADLGGTHAPETVFVDKGTLTLSPAMHETRHA